MKRLFIWLLGMLYLILFFLISVPCIIIGALWHFVHAGIEGGEQMPRKWMDDLAAEAKRIRAEKGI